MSPLLEVRGLSKTYRGRGTKRSRTNVHAVRDVSFTVDAGETLALVGESGAGKSTTGFLALRLIEPDSGDIRFDGRDIGSMSSRDLRSWRRRAQMVFQDPFGSFDPRKTILQSVVEPLVIHDRLERSRRHETAVAVLDRIGLSESVLERYPYEFSGGQLQRLAIARAIATEPALLVCDEPVAALDMSIQAQVLNLLKDLQRDAGIAMLFVSHDLSLVRSVADRIAVMYSGEIVELGTTRQVYDSPGHPYTKALLSAVPIPNPTTQRRRVKIALADTVAPPPAGCPFAPRCPDVMPVCWDAHPPMLMRTTGVEIACHHPDVPPPIDAPMTTPDARRS